MARDPHTLTSRFVRTNGIQMHYAEAGDGPAVVLLHGFPETHRSWLHQVPALVDAGFRVVTPDLRGYGSTDRPRHGYDVEVLGEDVAGLIESVAGGPVGLVGHDWGGAVAWQAATRHPELLRKLVVLNCPHPVRLAEALVSDLGQIRRSWYMFFFQLPMLPEWWLTRDDGANVERLFRASFRRPHRPSEEIVEASRRALLEPDAARAAIDYYRAAFRKRFRPRAYREALRSYGPVRVPVTVIWGEEDIALGIDLLQGTERFAEDLEILRVPGAGHFVHQEKPDEVNPRLVGALRGSQPQHAHRASATDEATVG